MDSTTAGGLRQQVALIDADAPIIVVTEDPVLTKLHLKVTGCYSDRGDKNRDYHSIFKIAVASGAQ